MAAAGAGKYWCLLLHCVAGASPLTPARNLSPANSLPSPALSPALCPNRSTRSPVPPSAPPSLWRPLPRPNPSIGLVWAGTYEPPDRPGSAPARAPSCGNSPPPPPPPAAPLEEAGALPGAAARAASNTSRSKPALACVCACVKEGQSGKGRVSVALGLGRVSMPAATAVLADRPGGTRAGSTPPPLPAPAPTSRSCSSTGRPSMTFSPGHSPSATSRTWSGGRACGRVCVCVCVRVYVCVCVDGQDTREGVVTLQASPNAQAKGEVTPVTLPPVPPARSCTSQDPRTIPCRALHAAAPPCPPPHTHAPWLLGCCRWPASAAR